MAIGTKGEGVVAKEIQVDSEPTEEKWKEWKQEAETIICQEIDGLHSSLSNEDTCLALSNLIHKPDGDIKWTVPKRYRLESIFRLIEEKLKESPIYDTSDIQLGWVKGCEDIPGVEIDQEEFTMSWPTENEQKILIHLLELNESQNIVATIASGSFIKETTGKRGEKITSINLDQGNQYFGAAVIEQAVQSSENVVEMIDCFFYTPSLPTRIPFDIDDEHPAEKRAQLELTRVLRGNRQRLTEDTARFVRGK